MIGNISIGFDIFPIKDRFISFRAMQSTQDTQFETLYDAVALKKLPVSGLPLPDRSFASEA